MDVKGMAAKLRDQEQRKAPGRIAARAIEVSNKITLAAGGQNPTYAGRRWAEVRQAQKQLEQAQRKLQKLMAD